MGRLSSADCQQLDSQSGSTRFGATLTAPDYTPFSAVSPEPDAAVAHVDPDLRDDNHLDTADGPGTGHMEVSREGAKYLGRGAGSLLICEDDEVRLDKRQKHSANGKSTHPTLLFPFMGSDKNLLSSVHELFPPAHEAYELLKVYGE